MIYLLKITQGLPHRWIDTEPYIKKVRFYTGKEISLPVPDPIEVTLKPLNPEAWDHGPLLPEYLKGNFPYFREDFIEVLKEGGIDNFQVFNVAITDPDNGQVYKNYKAVNIIGQLPMAVLGLNVTKNDDVVDGTNFNQNIADVMNLENLQMFRIENSNEIFIRHDLKEYLLKRDAQNFEFLDPKKCAL